MSKLFQFLVFVVLLIVIFVLAGKPSGYRRELEKQQAKYLNQLDSISGLNTGLMLKDSLLVVSLRVEKDSLSNALKKASNQRIKYVQIKPLVRPTDAELDSAITALYPRFTPGLRGS